jgi:hypothetical protein
MHATPFVSHGTDDDDATAAAVAKITTMEFIIKLEKIF